MKKNKFKAVSVSTDAWKLLGESRQIMQERAFLHGSRPCGGKLITLASVVELSISHYNERLKQATYPQTIEDTDDVCRTFLTQIMSTLGIEMKVNDNGDVEVSVDPEKKSVVLDLISGSVAKSNLGEQKKGRPDNVQSPPGVSQNQQP